jgi:organic radical activating enzyme
MPNRPMRRRLTRRKFCQLSSNPQPELNTHATVKSLLEYLESHPDESHIVAFPGGEPLRISGSEEVAEFVSEMRKAFPDQ